MTKNNGNDHIIPKWNGDLTTVDDYERDVKAYIRGTRRDERYVCGPRLWRRLEGRSRQAAKDVDWDRIEKDDGAAELLRHVRAKLGAQPIQDAGKYLARLLFDLRRDTGEPMPSYISRDDEAYHDVVKGFDTEYFKKQRAARLSEISKLWNTLYSELKWFLYKIEHEGPEDAAEVAKNLNWRLWSFVSNGLEEIPEHPDFGTDFNQAIPLDQLRGWLLLQRSRLSPTERAAVISALTNRDKKTGKDNHRHRERGRTHAGWEENSEDDDDYSYYDGEQSEVSYEDGDGDEDEGDPEEPLYSAQEIEDAETAFAAQQRSFEEARDLLRRVKTARKFYPDSASFKGPGLDPEALAHRAKDEAEGAGSDVADLLDEMEIAPKDAEMEANLITNETTRIELENAMFPKPVIKNKPKREKRQLDKTRYLQVEKSIEMRERVEHVKLPSWPTLEKLDDWILMSVKQSSSKGFGILDIGATSSIMGIEAAENLRDIIYEQTGQNIKMDVSQKSTFIFGDGNSKTCTGKATFPLKIAGVDGELEILDADAPLLIGVDVLSRLGAVIDCEAHSVCFKKLGPRSWSPAGLKHLISTYEHGDILITYSSDFGNQIAFHIRMSLNRETKCRKAESQQAKLENEEMDGPWEQVDVRVPLEDSGASATGRSPTSTRSTLQRILPQGRLIAHQDTKGNIFYAVESSGLDHSKKRMTDIFLLEYLPNWEMWSSKLLRQWTQCRRWGRVIQKVFLKTIDHVNWQLDSLGLPVQLLPEKYPTWPTDLEHRAMIEQCPPSSKTKKRPQKSTAAAAREQNQELRATIETAKSDFLTKFAEVSAFAALSSEQIHEQLSIVTLGNHLRPLCKMWGLTQSGKKEEVVDNIIAYIIEQRGSAAATIKIEMETETKKAEKAPTTIGPAIPAHYTQMCQHPDCKLCRGIAKNEPIVKVKPYGWCHQACAARSAIFGAMCALTTFGRLTMVDARTHEDSNLGEVCDEKGYHYERLGLFNENDLSKPQGYRTAKFLLDEKRPKLFVSTPPCGPWSMMQNVNQRDDRQRDNLRRKRLKSQRIFENNKRLIEHQVLNLNGSALAEQPHNSRSWQKTCWKDLHKILPYEVIVDGCACGLRAPDTGELMKKRWKFLANDEEIESSLRTEASGYYPKMLCRRILRALTQSQNQNYFEGEVVKCLCMAATQQPPTEPTLVEDEPTIPPQDGKETHDLTKETIKKIESYIRLVHTNLEQPHNGHEVLFDAFSWIRRSKKTNVMALAILDAGSDILYVRLIDEKEIPGTTRQVRAGDLRHIFATKWFSWMGRPKVMRYDPAGSAISNEFREWMESQGVYCLPCMADAHWQIGKIERAIEAFKEALDAFDEMVSAEVPTSEMIGLQTAARNDLIRIDGFSPLQRCAGRTPTGTTVNLPDEPNNLPLISAELQDGTFSRDAQVRRLARLARIQTENSDRGKRAEAARLRSFKRYETGDLVFVYRRLPPGAWIKKGQPRSMPGRGRWYGPGRAMDSLRSRREQPGTWTFGDVQKLLDQNEVIDLSNESPPTGEDLAADDGESVSARTFEGNASGPWAIPEDEEAFSYYLQEGNFYGDYTYSVQQYDETKEDDELIVLDIPVSNEHALMAYMDNPRNFVASQARKGRVGVSFKKATPEEKKLLLEAQQKECTSVLSTKAVRILSRKGIDPARLLRCRFVLTWKKDEQGNVLRGKARLVVLGFSDPDLLHLWTESPVASRRARQLLLAMAARHKWKREKADAVTAFLQGETDEEKRKIYADPPKDVRQASGMKDDDVLQFLKPMYGFVHAPRKWWLHFQDTLRTLKLEIVQCEPCVWVIRVGNKMVGMVILHVDDMMIAGDHNNSTFLKKRQEIQQAFEWTPWESRAFVQCGISVRQNEDYTCSLAQDSYSLNVKINKLIRTMNDTADVVTLIPAIEQIAVVGWGDAAWAARITGESQGGEIVVLAPLSFLSGSTETLECDQVDYTNKQHVNDAISSCPGVLATDGKSGYDAIEKSESAGLGLRDKRTSIECLGIRQQKEQTALQIRWVHSDAMLADGLTKDRAAKVLLEFFRSGQRWRLVDDPLHRSARKRKTEGLDKLDHGKPISDDDDDAMLEALIYYARDNPDKKESPAGDAALWGMIKPLTRSVLSVNSVARGRSRCRNIDL
ncbi:unnamed protein product [Prorocentrum cordatum]|uniref:Integrase catalytic domain-containing protein n=1 Tax=Prorocentrum cordatum TaxID=2364126 RepID=A0ABN9SGS1_9DINO|nr:unnamed protein product [Polarella glacialis]